MTQPHDNDQLTLTQIAELLGYTYGTARVMRTTGGLPEPDGQLGRTPWWYRTTIRAWKQAHGERSA